MKIRLLTASDRPSWDAYVHHHPESTHCHLVGWKSVIERTYGHKGYYLIAEEDSKVIGVLPLFHIKSLVFGNQIVSMPFLSYGGILCNGGSTASSLLEEAVKLASGLGTFCIELRHLNSLQCMPLMKVGNAFEKTHKVRMVLSLPESGAALLKSFRSKLRSQISRAERAGFKRSIGGAELLDPFYRVFSANMRDLGSPVHSKKFFWNICQEFAPNVNIGLVSHENGLPVSAGLIFRFRETAEIPWASSLRQFNPLSPNMLLYWSLLEYACERGHKQFDFGRSTPGEGTHQFKEQWGAVGSRLHWQYWTLGGRERIGIDSSSPKYNFLIRLWQKLPVSLSIWLGPRLRRSISL